MRPLHRTRPFFRAYEYFPHRLLNRSVALATAATRPRRAVDLAVAAWARLEDIDLSDFEARRFESLDDFFLRRLRPGARPVGPGCVSPADGVLVSRGPLIRDQELRIKGQRLSLERVVNAGLFELDLAPYDGGQHCVVFLTPRGYHRVHAPTAGEILDVRWIPGRYFPQNEDALEHVPRIYERNERVVLRCLADAGFEYLLILVGASLIGGIHLCELERAEFVGQRVTSFGRAVQKGEEIGHFAFGSTVVLLLPESARVGPVLVRGHVRMGETLFE
jgi:phosphatidylserine decarboxylase